MAVSSRPVVVLAKWLAAATALFVAIGAPAGYLYFGYQRATGAIFAESTLMARQISQLISSNPDYWQFETIRIDELLGKHQLQAGAESHRVIDKDGTVIAAASSIADSSRWPTLANRQPLKDYGVPVAELETVYSLEDLYRTTLVIAAISFATGLLIYWGCGSCRCARSSGHGSGCPFSPATTP